MSHIYITEEKKKKKKKRKKRRKNHELIYCERRRGESKTQEECIGALGLLGKNENENKR